jgi:hypothetical protein
MVDKVKLAYLDLTELVPYTFRGIKKLRSLHIENSDLATIKSNAFAGITKTSLSNSRSLGNLTFVFLWVNCYFHYFLKILLDSFLGRIFLLLTVAQLSQQLQL